MQNNNIKMHDVNTIIQILPLVLIYVSDLSYLSLTCKNINHHIKKYPIFLCKKTVTIHRHYYKIKN